MRLHEQTQRFILLLTFYLFGPILTLGIIVGIGLRKHPSHPQSWAQSLSQQTGLHWKIQSVEYCSPGFVRLHHVEILDDTVQPPLFSAEKIEVRRITDTSLEKIFPGISTSPETEKTGLTGLVAKTFPSLYSSDHFWQITIPFSELNFGKYPGDYSALLVQSMLRKVFARFDTLSEVPVQLVFEEIAVMSEHSLNKTDQIDMFRFVQGNIYQIPSEIRSDWSFQIKDVPEIDRQRLSFVLLPPDKLEIAFQTGSQPIPCDLAAVFCSSFKHFSGGSFQGDFALSSQNGSNRHTIRLQNAIFSNMPLASLAQPYTNFAVSGTVADFRFTHAVFGPRPEDIDAEGSLLVQEGTVEKALLHRCVDKFQIKIEPEDILDSPMPMIPFTACAIHFRLQPWGIEFGAHKDWGMAFMYQKADTIDSGLKMLLSFPLTNRERPVTYHEIMSIFAPNNAPTVPLTPGTQPILPHIPAL